MDNKPVIKYLNTDLDLICDIDPSVLAKELKSDTLSVNVTAGEDKQWYILCEDYNESEPEPNINRLLDAIDSLSDSSRAILNQCSKIEFNVGYDCGDEPWSFNQGLSNNVLRRMAEIGATFRITLYPYRPDSDSVNELE